MKIIHLSFIGLLFSLISYSQVNTRKKKTLSKVHQYIAAMSKD